MEQGNLFVEEEPVQVLEVNLPCRRCGGETKKLTVAEGFAGKLYVLCGRCKGLGEEGEAKLASNLGLTKKSKKPAITFPPIETHHPSKVVICKTKEELHIVNQNGLVGVLHLACSL